MATVGSTSAYAVRSFHIRRGDPVCVRWRRLTNIFVNLSCVGGWARIDRNYCCAKNTLWSRLVICLPVAPCFVHPTHWFLNGRRRQALPRFATLYECVSHDICLSLCRTMMGTSITVWPANLVTCALFNTLHSQVYSGFRDTGMSRERFFLYGFLASFIWCMCALYVAPFVANSIVRFLSWVSVHRSIHILLGK
jgi:OPT oligopeptide transporter protein